MSQLRIRCAAAILLLAPPQSFTATVTSSEGATSEFCRPVTPTP